MGFFLIELHLVACTTFSIKSQKSVVFLLKKSTQPLKNVKFFIKKSIFFTQKEHPAPQKTEVLHEKKTQKMTKN